MHIIIKDSEKLTISDKIRSIMQYRGLTIKEVAAAMGLSPASLSHKLHLNKFKYSEMEKIAEIAGCEFICKFSFPDFEI